MLPKGCLVCYGTLAEAWAAFTRDALLACVSPPNVSPFATKRLALERAHLPRNQRFQIWVILLDDAADEIARIDAILRPLSLAVPELRVLMHSDDDGRTPKGASMRCWHARCGYDWTDPVFY